MESEAIEEDKNLVVENWEIIRDEKLRSPDHTKPVTEIQNSAPRVITPSKPLQKSRSSDSDILQDEDGSAPNGDHAAHYQDSAIKDPPSSNAERGKREPIDVDPDDYKKLDVPLRGPCDRCYSGMLEYIEWLTPGWMARINETSRRICKMCFKAAKNRKAKSFRVLPGSLNVAGIAP